MNQWKGSPLTSLVIHHIIKAMNKTAKKLIQILSILAALALICLYPVPVQDAIVSLVERMKHDTIRAAHWKQQIFAFSTIGLIFIIILNLTLWTKRGQEIFHDFINAIKRETSFILDNKKYFIFITAALLLGYFTIINNNFSYIAVDDLQRQMEGVRHWVNWYRYISEFGSIFLHTSTRLIDIAPLTQFIAIFFIALASFIAAQSATDGKLTYFSCIASLPIGLFPYFMSNIAYRYDSPYMSLSVFACILPFAFKKETTNYIIASVIGLFAMCLSYQASNGIYIVMTILCALRMRQENEKWSAISKFILVSACCYIGTLLLFNISFMEKEYKQDWTDVRTDISFVPKNIITYTTTIWQGLGKSPLKLFIVIAMAINLIMSVALPKQGKIMSFLLTLLFYMFAIPLSYGVFLAMSYPLWHPRAMYGIGAFVAATLFLLAANINKCRSALKFFPRAAIFATSYCCLAFTIAFGNAQFEQNKYAEFRMKLLAEDLSKIVENDGATKEIIFANDVEHAPVVKNLIAVYPLAYMCVDKYAAAIGPAQTILKSIGFLEFESGESHNLAKKNLPVILETSFHKIQGQGNQYFITFNNTPIRVIDTVRVIDD